jgi:5-methylthioribose kinase
VATYLRRRGLVGADAGVQAQALGGGVSNVVLAVHVGERHMVVKQSLPRLRVADEWLAKRERVLTEAAALQLAGTLTPGAVPAVLDVDGAMCAITIQEAPREWQNWKDLLLSGAVDSTVARRLGDLLATWHRATHSNQQVAQRFTDTEAFDQLRVDPYYRTVMRRWPDLAPTMAPFVERMLDTHACLVHGDYSPKNVLVGTGGLWVLDFEVAHVGDPVFDIAFLLNHLALKAIHRPSGRGAYEQAAHAFWDTYRSGVPGDLLPPIEYVLGHLGCLMVARVDGKSPAEYLTAQEKLIARALGTRLLLQPPRRLSEVWSNLEETSLA